MLPGGPSLNTTDSEDTAVTTQDVAGDILSAALDYAQRLGWFVFPVRGKVPAFVKSWREESTRDPAVIAAWFAGTSGLGVAVDMEKSRLVAVDGDHLDRMSQALWEALSSSSGWTHQGNPERCTWLFTWPADGPVPQARHTWGDVKAGGGYIVLSPSPHPDGYQYTWLNRGSQVPPPLPAVLVPLIAPQTRQEAPESPWSGGEASQAQVEHCEALRARLCASVASAAEGGRNNTLNEAAMALGHYVPHVLGHAGTYGMLLDAALACGLDADEARATIRSGMGAGMRDPQKPQGVLEPFALASTVGNAGDEGPGDWRQTVGMVDWGALWAADEPEREALIPGVWTCGALGTLYSGPGVGKSLLALEWAASLATGQDILGLTVAPRTVLYLDHENDRTLLRERLEAMGFGAGDDLGRLHYSLLGDWEALDTARGGAQLQWAAEQVGADLVVIDTTARVIVGEENQADTFHNLYRHTLRPLKAMGVATMRLDHTGKDAGRGERGSSAKRGDVDLAYALSLTGPETVALHRVKNRLHLEGDDTVMLQRQASPLRHVPVSFDHAQEARIVAMVDLLDKIGFAPDSTSRRDAQAALKASGHGVGKGTTLDQALLRRALREAAG